MRNKQVTHSEPRKAELEMTLESIHRLQRTLVRFTLLLDGESLELVIPYMVALNSIGNSILLGMTTENNSY